MASSALPLLSGHALIVITFDDLDIEFGMVRFELFEELWKQERSNGLKASYDAIVPRTSFCPA